MTFFADPRSRGRETLLERLHEYGIFVLVALGIINVYGFELLAIQNLNFIMTFFTQPIARRRASIQRP